MLKKYVFRPGINRDMTSYSNEGGWYFCDQVRFRAGLPESIGGWVNILTSTFLGVCKLIYTWATLSGNITTALGTNLKFYVVQGGTANDVTPIRVTTNPLGNNPFASTINTKLVVVTDASNAPSVNDYIDFSGATTFGGIPAASLNTSLQVVTINSGTTYTVLVDTNATSTTTGGGAAVVAAYEIPTGPAVQTSGVGWGAGTWGNSGYGQSVGSGATTSLRLWSAESFGEDLVFADKGGDIYYWDASTGVGTRAVFLSAMVGASDVPTVVNSVFVADDHHIIALGANAIGSVTVDPMFVRWSDTEDAIDWTPVVTNTAGGQRLDEGSFIVRGISSKSSNLIWTDTALYTMTFIGAPLVYSFNLVDKNLSIASPNSVVQVNNNVYWMGNGKFYMYDGRVSTLPCTVLDFVFRDVDFGVDFSQSQQIYAGSNQRYNEIMWLYPSLSSATGYCDRYVIFNYSENLWYFGSLNRTAWYDSSLFGYPIASSVDVGTNSPMFTPYSNLYQHEIGANPGVATITSADFDIDDGDHLSFIRRVLPDINFDGSTVANPAVDLTLESKVTSGSLVSQTQTGTITKATSNPNSFTPYLYVRLRGRQVTLTIDGGINGTMWQLGGVRLDIQPDGRQ